MQFPQVPSYFLSLKPIYLTQNPILEHPQPMFLCNVSEQVAHLHITAGYIMFPYTGLFNFVFLDSKWRKTI
jgi:hypothetical protein